MKHSLLSASGAERWANCPGSIAYNAGVPKTDSDASREGTAGHALGDLCLRQGTEPEDFVGETFCDYEITDDLATAVQAYVDYVRGISGIRMSEVRVYYGALLGVQDEEAFGTSDVILVAGNVLHIIDAKFGRRFVDPRLNKQMMLYAAGALQTLEAVGEADDITEVHLHIMQPRVSAKPVPYCMTRDELSAELQSLRDAAQRVIEAQMAYVPGDPKWAEKYLIPGEYQCQWCPGAASCPSLRFRAKSVTPIEEFDVLNALETLPSSVVSENLKLVPLLEIWIKAVEHEGLRRLTRGDQVPGFKMVLGREGNRKWISDDAAKEQLELSLAAKQLPPETIHDLLHAPSKLKTMPQLEKVLKKAKLTDTVALLPDLVVRAPARPCVTTEDDPRPKWVESAAADEFGVVS
jgi:hypothetical protein